jgi:hypothetical protein
VQLPNVTFWVILWEFATQPLSLALAAIEIGQGVPMLWRAPVIYSIPYGEKGHILVYSGRVDRVLRGRTLF